MNDQKEDGCPFCVMSMVERRVVFEEAEAYALTSLWPGSPYHTLVVPRRHIEREADLTAGEVVAIHGLRMKVAEAVAKAFGLREYNSGVNVGRLAGQTQPHLHYHMLFRTPGDLPNPRGGVRNLLAPPLDPSTDSHEPDVEEWAKEIREALCEGEQPTQSTNATFTEAGAATPPTA